MNGIITPQKQKQLMSSPSRDPLSTTELSTPTSQTTVDVNDTKKSEGLDSTIILLTPGTSPNATPGSSELGLSKKPNR